MRQNQPLPAVRDVHHFRHIDPVVTHFGLDGINTPSNILTLIIRTDTKFATRDLLQVFSASNNEISLPANKKCGLARFHQAVESAYAQWGKDVVHTLAGSLDYEGKYALSQPSDHGTLVHFHSADSLASSVVREASSFVQQTYTGQEALYISLDDMIDQSIFERSCSQGVFKEIGFSRLFSHAGEELCFVGRPGHPTIEKQIEAVRTTLAQMRQGSEKRTPIILLEDNVRRAKTLLWVVKQMEQGGVFKDGELAGVATCFSVANKDELSKMTHESKTIPLIVGVNYADSRVDVVTPRDHLFDGFVVQNRDGSYGRLPSFMLSDEQKLADNFKIHRDLVKSFRERIIETNMQFCATVEDQTGVVLPIGCFTPGSAIAEILDACPTTPALSILESIKKHSNQPLRLVQ